MQEYRTLIYSFLCSTLTVIFTVGQGILREESIRGDDMDAFKYLIHISGVSRPFRKVALETTSLWTVVFAMSLPLDILHVYFKRSGSQLIYI